jgi:hypothetical protein
MNRRDALIHFASDNARLRDLVDGLEWFRIYVKDHDPQLADCADAYMKKRLGEKAGNTEPNG